MSTSKVTYHHGDLRAALVHAAMELLEESGETDLSLRAVARRAGVSPAAPYRHYADREALVSAVAAVGYRELAERLAAAHPSPSTPEQLASVAIAYVQFALERPTLFRIMFTEPCDRDNDERVAATAQNRASSDHASRSHPIRSGSFRFLLRPASGAGW